MQSQTLLRVKSIILVMLYGRRSIPGSSYTTTHVTYERSVPRQEYDEEY